MPESLEEFLKNKNRASVTKVGGSLTCQECNEVVHEGNLDEESMILSYTCSKRHESRVKL